jgi:hypothetical protein
VTATYTPGGIMFDGRATAWLHSAMPLSATADA